AQAVAARAVFVLRVVTDILVTPGAAPLILTLEHGDGRIETIETTDEHPFRVGNQWLRADGLTPGSVVETIGGTATVSAIRYSSEREVVYNLTVEGTHTYLIGDDRVWVHNINCIWSRNDVIATASQKLSGGLTRAGKKLEGKYHLFGFGSTADMRRAWGNLQGVNQRAEHMVQEAIDGGIPRITSDGKHVEYIVGTWGMSVRASDGQFVGWIDPTRVR
ncbi:MAG: polymorphic toxin-type HINT domain-containing protein, partial [Planctomycetota bacterium]